MGFDWYRKIKTKQYNKKYSHAPSGLEVAHKYNRVNPKRKATGNWLTDYVSLNNKDVKQVSL